MNDENVILSEASAASVVEESFGAGRGTKDPSTSLRVTAYFLSNIKTRMFKCRNDFHPFIRLRFCHWNLAIGIRSDRWWVRATTPVKTAPFALDPPYRSAV
ncbi:MAG: hypothetical protein HY673_27370 [Chloroflexi bacterium]|nr:hypothetical protein [Chloroflexota bacterium]